MEPPPENLLVEEQPHTQQEVQSDSLPRATTTGEQSGPLLIICRLLTTNEKEKRRLPENFNLLDACEMQT